MTTANDFVQTQLTLADELCREAERGVIQAKADGYDLLLRAFRCSQVAAMHAQYMLNTDVHGKVASPAFSPESLRAMEELAATEAQPTPHDPLDTAPAAQPAVTTTPDPLDAPRPRRGGRRSRGGEGSPQAEAAPETTPQPEPQPDDLDLPGEPLSDATAEAGPALDAAPSADPVDALFGSPDSGFDPLA